MMDAHSSLIHAFAIRFVKLTKNYRSHQAILDYPNDRFYNGELEVCGPPAVIDSFLGSPQLVSPRFPVVFHAISGKNDREASSPSYFNIDEAIQTKAYIVALLADRQFAIRECSQAVCRASYIRIAVDVLRQVRRTSASLRRTTRKCARSASCCAKRTSGTSRLAAWRSSRGRCASLRLSIGALYDAHARATRAQERRVIIVTTVRSSADLLVYDAKFTLGFLSNPRRFNGTPCSPRRVLPRPRHSCSFSRLFSVQWP